MLRPADKELVRRLIAKAIVPSLKYLLQNTAQGLCKGLSAQFLKLCGDAALGILKGGSLLRMRTKSFISPAATPLQRSAEVSVHNIHRAPRNPKRGSMFPDFLVFFLSVRFLSGFPFQPS